jgi:hypothetical protein
VLIAADQKFRDEEPFKDAKIVRKSSIIRNADYKPSHPKGSPTPEGYAWDSSISALLIRILDPVVENEGRRQRTRLRTVGLPASPIGSLVSTTVKLAFGLF